MNKLLNQFYVTMKCSKLLDILIHLYLIHFIRYFKFWKYLENYNRTLSSRDADKFVDGEQSVIDLTHLVNQFSLLRNKYLGIMKGLDTKQWQIGHITRLRTAGMEDIVID